MGSPFLFPGDTKLEVVSRILRHAGVGTTADIYRHVRTEELHEEAARFAPFNTPALPEATGREDGYATRQAQAWEPEGRNLKSISRCPGTRARYR